MPLKVTKQTLEVLGTNLGVVQPLGIGTLFPPFFKANWRQRVILESAWQTSITQAKSSGAEERIQQRKRPLRTQVSLITGMSQQESTQLQFSLMAMCGTGGTDNNRGVPFPIYSDRTTLEDNFLAGSTFIECDTTLRRFYRGQRVILVKQSFGRITFSGIDTTGGYAEIVDVFPNGLEVTDPFTGVSFRAGDNLFPMMDIHPSLSISTTPVTDNHLQLRLTVLEQSGSNTIPPTWIGEINEFVDYSLGHPIFALDTNWKSAVNFSIVRQGERYTSGRGTVVETEADRPKITFEVSELDGSRQEAWNLLRFFDSRQGRTKPFWTIQPITLWDVRAATTTTIDVAPYDYLQNLQDYITHIGIEFTDGTSVIKAVDSITRPVSDFQINFASDPLTTPQSLSIKRISPAWLSRFSSDSIRQVWTTENVSTVQLGIEQILNETSVVIPNV